MSISVAICTWNRAESLRRTLASFKDLKPLPDKAWELIIIDNNSTDNTRQIVDEFHEALPIRYVFEPAQGLSHARNRALREVRYDFVLWTDDDVYVEPDWLIEHAAAMSMFPDAAFFGGPIDPYFVIEPPHWLSRNLDVFEGAYALRQFGSQSHYIQNLSRCPYGANMAMRKSALEHISFDVKLGRGSSGLMGGEEFEIFRYLLDKGCTGVWVGRASVKHIISSDRLTKQYIWDYFYWSGRTKERQLHKSPNDINKSKIDRKYRRVFRDKLFLCFKLRRNHDWAVRFVWCADWLGRIDEMRSILDNSQSSSQGMSKSAATN